MNDTPTEQPIDGVLDLHTFRPEEIKDLVPDYLEECRARGITQVRIIHGKGIGTQRTIVRTILERLPYVRAVSTADEAAGGWGATIVVLEQKAKEKA